MIQRHLKNLILLPIICTLIACLLLYAVACIPDSLLEENSSRSAKNFKNMGPWVVLLNEDDPSCTLDTYTDQQIIMESYTLSLSRPGSVLLNPRHWTENESQSGAFDMLINQGEECNNNYFRYWMGFRILYRPLLIFNDYFGILKFMAAALLILIFFTASVLGQKLGTATGFCFFAAIALMNPAIIAQSLQFICCFILALLFILLALKLENLPDRMPEMFCFFGIATQFFDFYTSPLLCYGFPALLMLTLTPFRNSRWKNAGISAATWMYGYVSMWLMKLSCVTVFTDENGFFNGFDSLAGRLGIKIVEGLEEKYDIKGALSSVWWTSCPGENEMAFFLLLAFAVVSSALIIYRRQGLKALVSCGAYLAVAVTPVIWFSFAAQPTLIHFWFQYRSIAVLFAGIFIFVRQALFLPTSFEAVKPL